MTPILEVKDLEVKFKTSFGEVKAIRKVSFDLSEGETLALVGESGSGKSVTSKAIMKLLASNGKICGGEIKYNNKVISNLNKKEICKIRGKEIAMIFQDPMTSLNPTTKIGKQIRNAYMFHHKCTKKEAKQKVYDLIAEVGIDRPELRYNQYAHQFSGGMRQRIVIAIAIACNPKILICDEPTTALDVTIQAQILELLKTLKEKHKTAIIFITHDLGVVANIADRIAVMYAGEIVEIGKSHEIFYKSEHPYTWGLLGSMPHLETDDDKLYAIPGSPPNLLNPPKGDAFSLRSKYALVVDRENQPPFFKISETHYAKTWLLHEFSPKVVKPKSIQIAFEKYKSRVGEIDE